MVDIRHLAVEAESHRLVDGRETFSQAHQDLFCLAVNQFKTGGTYFEIGAGHPRDSSNSFLLESRYGWSGCSIEMNEDLVKHFKNERNNPVLCVDATTANYVEMLERYFFDFEIDYLSLDIDPSFQTLRVLEQLPLDQFSFRAITFEHDRYSQGIDVMERSRALLKSIGYILIGENIKCVGRDFEDWYVSKGQAELLKIPSDFSVQGECAEAVSRLISVLNQSGRQP